MSPEKSDCTMDITAPPLYQTWFTDADFFFVYTFKKLSNN